MFSVIIASAWFPFTPMTNLQILAQNLLYDISQIAIPWDNVDAEYLESPKSWQAWGKSKHYQLLLLIHGKDSNMI